MLIQCGATALILAQVSFPLFGYLHWWCKRMVGKTGNQVANKFSSLYKMGKIPWKTKLSTWIQEETENLNSLIRIKEIESVNKNLSKKKSPEPYSFTGEFFQTFQKQMIQIIYKFFKITEKRKCISICFVSQAYSWYQNLERSL